ncbi:type IV secretory system conjugative DNA transfer family protein [Campylobacter sp. US33a]|uniref:type IV secretory system conjugative DNA transfer family protein n=1 Tax=Campylobacter sp. US33a TaxID=2498120 RepID=UPI00106750A6|nr:TraM recognition domain-containing protein [Campylobacter sp. US33a]TEY00692.1 hypothetical protein ELQ16_08640 [Campylobacter sp. US33a]
MKNYSQETAKTVSIAPERYNTLEFLRSDTFFTWLFYITGFVASILCIVACFTLSANILVFIWTSVVLHISLILGLYMSVEKVDTMEAIIPNEPNKKYLLNLGNEVQKFYGDAVKTARVKNNQLRPLLVNAETVKRHFLCMATVGAGKTVFMKGLLEQYIKLGGGGVAVDAKGTDEFAREMYGLFASLGREDDFFHINFLDMAHTHTINPLTSGNANALFEILLPLLTGEEDTWKSKAKEMMLVVLKLCVYKRDNEKDFVLNFSYIQKILNAKTLSNLALEYKHLADRKNPKFDIGIEDFCLWASKSFGFDYNEFLSADPNDEKIIKKIDEEIAKGDGSPGVYSINVGVGFWSKPLMTLGSDYGRVFNVPNPDISLWEASQRNKFIFITLPSMDSVETPKQLGRIILSLIQAVAGKKVKDADEPVIPFLTVLDEFGSFVNEGFALFESKSRSLGMAMMPFFQSPSQIDVVAKNDYERRQMIDVTGVHIIMKTLHPETSEFYSKMVPKVKILERNYSQRREGATTAGNAEDSYGLKEEDAIKPQEAMNMSNGEMMVIANGKLHRAVARAESSLLSKGKKTTYDESPLPITEYVSKSEFFTEVTHLLENPILNNVFKFDKKSA